MFLKNYNRMNLRKDIPAGIMAGKAAGMTVFAVEDEFSEPLREKKLALADGWVRDYTDFI